MKKIFVSLLFFALALTGCGEVNDSVVVDTTNPVETKIPDKIPDETDKTTDENAESERYVLFTINTQEFIYTDQSVYTINRIIDVHEKYKVPVDVYLTEDILLIYETEAPDLIERLKTSPMVAVSYHHRPPNPFYVSAYDFLDLPSLSKQDLYDTLLHYEEHATDPVTGVSTEAVGGYQHVKDVIGYAPVVVGMSVGDKNVGETLGQIFKEKGASFVIVHDGVFALGDERYGLPIRPENIEVKLFEDVGQDAETLLNGLWKGEDDYGFMNIKVHDNDFIATASAWTSIYVRQKPPYDLSRGTSKRSLLTESEAKPMWDIYEQSVKYVSEHPELYTAINAFDLQGMIDEGNEGL